MNPIVVVWLETKKTKHAWFFFFFFFEISKILKENKHKIFFYANYMQVQKPLGTQHQRSQKWRLNMTVVD